MTTLNETTHAGEFIVAAPSGNLPNEEVTVLSGQDLETGAVLGKILMAQAAAPNPTVDGTGNGTMTGVKPGKMAQAGTYTVTCTAAATDGGTFSVTAPDGTVLPSATVGTAYSSEHLEFTINDGSTDFIVGDQFDVAITEGGTPAVVGTGNGTMSSISLGRSAEHGSYTVECVTAPDVADTAPTTGTADGGNTGDGTMTAVTKGSDAQIGTYTVTCVTAPDNPDTGAAAGSAAAYSGNTGNGTFGDIAVAAGAIVGDYNLVVIEPATDAGAFEVQDPNGDVVGTGAVGTEFTGGGLTFTLSDGATDFVAGDGFAITVASDGTGGAWEVSTPTGEQLAENAEVGSAYSSDHIDFTLNAGAADFVAGDKFTVAISVTGNGGEFRVSTPSGETLPPAQIGTAYTSDHVNFTLNDGSTDFVAGDKFHIPVVRGASYGKVVAWDPTTYDGRHQVSGILFDAVDASSADAAGVSVSRGEVHVDDSLLAYGSSITTAQKAAAVEQLAGLGIIAR